MIDYGMRYYNPGLGRWISWDPIGEDGGVNIYDMVWSNPVNRYDILGQMGNLRIDPCKQFQNSNPNRTKEMGGVVCYNGVLHYCCWHSEDFPAEYRSQMAYCVRQHEMDHVDDVQTCSDHPCDRGHIYMPPWDPAKDRAAEECEAYTREMKCLIDQMKKTCNKLHGKSRDDCEEAFEDVIEGVKRDKTTACSGRVP